MIDILVPIEQEGTKAIVRSWLRQIGDTVAENDPLVELETDKVTQEVPAPAAGVLVEIVLATDAEAVPGAVLGRLNGGAEVAVGDGGSGAGVGLGAPVTHDVSRDEPALSPSVRRAVLEHGIDPKSIAGSGRGGRITRADVDQAVATRAVSAQEPAAASPAPPPTDLAPLSSVGTVRSIPHDRMRRSIASNMLASVTAAPHVTAIFEADFSAIIAHRRRHKPLFAEEGANLTFTAYFIAAAVAAMRAAPAVNSRWFDDRLEIYDDVNIGVGTALGDKGLIVPVVARAQELSLIGIAKRLDDLTTRARAGRLLPEDVRGGTFTLSNHGVSGSLLAAPIIINQPQSAILGLGKLEKRVVVREVEGLDTIQVRPLAYVSLTIDHRVLDGHQTNAWLTRFVETLEAWPIDD